MRKPWGKNWDSQKSYIWMFQPIFFPHLFPGFITTLCAEKKYEILEADARDQIQTGQGRDG